MTALHGRDSNPRNCLAVGQIELGLARRDHLDAGLIRKRADLRPDLAGSAKQEKAHPSRALLGQAAAAAGVVLAKQRLPPGAILEVPFHGREKARLEGVLRLPAELGVELGKIDRIAEIVPGTIGDKGDQLAMRRAVRGSAQAYPSHRRSR